MQPHDYKKLFEHIDHCNSANLQKNFLPFKAHDQIVGWASPGFLEQLAPFGITRDKDRIHTLPKSLSLQELGNQLITHGFIETMNEVFDVYPAPYAKPVDLIDRSLIPSFGLIGTGVHLNGLVQDKDQVYLWIGKRASNKRLDPGKLDHIVAGGIPAGYHHQEALYKEAIEEANIPKELVQKAEYKSMITYSMLRPEGLRRDVLYCYDLWLPKDFVPQPNDGEVESFQLMRLEEVFQKVCTTEAFKFNVNLVLIDLFLRIGLIPKRSQQVTSLKTGLRGKLFP